jgi:hypothetical protein
LKVYILGIDFEKPYQIWLFGNLDANRFQDRRVSNSDSISRMIDFALAICSILSNETYLVEKRKDRFLLIFDL